MTLILLGRWWISTYRSSNWSWINSHRGQGTRDPWAQHWHLGRTAGDCHPGDCSWAARQVPSGLAPSSGKRSVTCKTQSSDTFHEFATWTCTLERSLTLESCLGVSQIKVNLRYLIIFVGIVTCRSRAEYDTLQHTLPWWGSGNLLHPDGRDLEPTHHLQRWIAVSLCHGW